MILVRGHRWRGHLTRGLLVLAGVVASLLLVELLLRGVAGFLPATLRAAIGPRNLGVAHPYIGHLQTPNSAFVVSGKDFRAVHRTDAHGFRNGGLWPGRAEIVAVGDSLTFGHGVEAEQVWAAVLVKAFPGSRVINLGLSGSGPQQYLRVYETFGVPLQPRLLLIGFFPRNDFWDTGLFDRWLRSGIGGNYMVWRDTGRPASPGAARGRSAPAWKQALAWPAFALGQTSYLFNLVRHTWSTRKQRVSRREVYPFPDGTRLLLLPDDFSEKTEGARPGRLEYQLVVEAFRRLAGLATEQGTRTTVILQPSKEEVYLPLLGISVADPSEGVREALARLGVDYVDVTPLFRERAAAGRRLFFEEDGHPNAEGHALIADAVLRHLETRGHSASRHHGGAR